MCQSEARLFAEGGLSASRKKALAHMCHIFLVFLQYGGILRYIKEEIMMRNMGFAVLLFCLRRFLE
jgi:hypothetical protein